jgi:hypothetical protein
MLPRVPMFAVVPAADLQWGLSVTTALIVCVLVSW